MERIAAYKNNAKIELAKSKRTEATKRIRSSQRDSEVTKRRKLDEAVDDYANKTPLELLDIIAGLTDEPAKAAKAYESLRLQLNESITHDVILGLLSTDIIVQMAVSFKIDDPMLNYEILWALTNLTALLRPNEIEQLFAKRSDTLHFIIKRLTSFITTGAPLPLSCLACWAIGNILADSGEMREHFLRVNILEHIVSLAELDDEADTEFISIQAWLIGNILRNNHPPVHHSICIKALPRLIQLLKTNVPSIQADIMRGLTSITVYAERVDYLMTLNGTIFIDILRHSTDETLINATLTVIGNIISSSEVHTSFFLKQGLFNLLKQFIDEKTHRAIVCMTLGNICTGKPNSFCFMLTDESIMNKLIDYAINADWKVKQHALTVLMNIILHCEKYQVLHLAGAFNLQSVLCPCLRLSDLDYVRCAVRVINRLHTIIDTEENNVLLDKFHNEFDESSGELLLDSLSNYCQHDQIAAEAARLLEKIQTNQPMH